MKHMLNAQSYINDKFASCTIATLVSIWNDACRADDHPELMLLDGINRKAQVLRCVENRMLMVTPDTEVILANTAVTGDVIYNWRNGERYTISNVTLCDNDTVILANPGDQTFYTYPEHVTIIKRVEPVTTTRNADEMTLVQIPAGELSVGDWIYFMGFYRQVIDLRKLENNVRWFVAGASQLIGKSVMIDVGKV